MTSRREAELIERVRTLVVEACEPLDVELLDVELRGQGPRRVVRIVADTAGLEPESGLDVDAIAELSRRVGAALDAQDVVPGSYTLEVTSPGVDRPLRTSRDFARNVGRDVRVHRVDGQQTAGAVVEVADATVTLEANGQRATLDLADIDFAKVVLPW